MERGCLDVARVATFFVEVRREPLAELGDVDCPKRRRDLARRLSQAAERSRIRSITFIWSL